ncbi:hypothetical protein TNCV_4649141 [Trichonephila clavipes]|uniref:Tc1-like transposase DDE domain-containing protein n=1 Tax=Trichonephila clavipes TaxID=2585209 RepID=A0A8X6STJ0_TRICX|nr:hypothetical protein TNCV_4649141 [Trichonephila clavipes]
MTCGSIFLLALQNPTFHQDNAQPHFVGIVRNFLDTENVQLLSWPAHSLDLLSIENVWSMVAERHGSSPKTVTTLDELWNRVKAALAFVPVHAIQSLFD